MAYGAPYGYGGFTPQYQPHQYPQQVQQPVQSPQYIVRPVASEEEARAMPTDFSGAPTVMPDRAHGYVYMKQLNIQTGCADFERYRREQEQEINKPLETDLSKYVPRSEFDELKQRFNTLCDQLGGTKHDE